MNLRKCEKPTSHARQTAFLYDKRVHGALTNSTVRVLPSCAGFMRRLFNCFSGALLFRGFVRGQSALPPRGTEKGAAGDGLAAPLDGSKGFTRATSAKPS